MMEDIHAHPEHTAPTVRLSGDCRQLPPTSGERFDLAVTSPPYLNGTNYFRNTKIELWLLGLIDGESDLAGYHAQAVAAGINNVSRESR